MSWLDPPPVVKKPMASTMIRLPAGMDPRRAMALVYGGLILGVIAGGAIGVFLGWLLGRGIHLPTLIRAFIITTGIMLGGLLAHAAIIRFILRSAAQESASS